MTYQFWKTSRMLSMKNLNLLCSPVLSPKVGFIFVFHYPCVPTVPSVAGRNLVRARHILRDGDKGIHSGSNILIYDSCSNLQPVWGAGFPEKRFNFYRISVPFSNGALIKKIDVFLPFIIACLKMFTTCLVKELPLHQEP